MGYLRCLCQCPDCATHVETRQMVQEDGIITTRFWRLFLTFRYNNALHNETLNSVMPGHASWHHTDQIKWYLSMNRQQMSVPVIENMVGRRQEWDLMNTFHLSAVYVGQFFLHILSMVSSLGIFSTGRIRKNYSKISSNWSFFRSAPRSLVHVLSLSWIMLRFIIQRYVNIVRLIKSVEVEGVVP